ncbi:WSC domain-containing protein [Copromyces sp. CBS 386.78]|nr:WSC domain-containing protein [Copromyces sp. CBS 386.78]
MPPLGFVSSPSSTCLINLFLVFFLAFNSAAPSAAEAASTSSSTTQPSRATATIASGTNGNKDIGCHNKTITLPGTGSGTRALYGGINEVLPGEMTVGKCLAFCKGGMEKGYRFSGLDYSRECWCATQLFSLSSKVPDAECNLACDGDKSQICGGDLKISIYDLNGVVSSCCC